MTLRGIDDNEAILVPLNAAPLLSKINDVATEGQKRRLVKDIEKSMLSIEHKLNIARYNAGLIRNMNEEDFERFLNRHRFSRVEMNESKASYKRSVFIINDADEYLLFLTFFLEAFSAAAFSLLDVCGYLLKDLYDLPLPKINSKGKVTHNVTYINALDEPALQARSIHLFLSAYRPKQPHSVPWIEPLKKIRNRTTHSPITDICRLPSRSEENLYTLAKKQPVETKEFLFYDDLFPGRTTATKLKEFVKECFDGLEEFVEELYDRLRQEVTNAGALPL